MKKFDLFNQFFDPMIVVRDYETVVFKNSAFCRVFTPFYGIRQFAHQMTFEMCPVDSENVDLYSPVFQAIVSKEPFSARVSYSTGEGNILYYDLTALKRGRYTIIRLVDVSADVMLENNRRENDAVKIKLNKLEEENDELQKIRLKAQSQAIKIALINKVSNIIRESVDISVILNSALKELVVHVENEQRLLAENKELQPKGEYYDKLCDNKAYFNFRDTAKLLGIKQKELITFLMEHKYIYKDGHKKIQPYSEYVEREDNINNGFFVKKEFTANGLSGAQTLITPKGRMKLLSILRPEVVKAEVVYNES